MSEDWQVLLFRHGPAEAPRADASDLERELTPAGIRATRAAARGLATLVSRPARIVSSPARRAARTAALLQAAWPGASLHVDPRLAPGAQPAALVEVLAEHPAPATVLVGHEPDLGTLACHLLGAPALRLRLAKAGAVWLCSRPGTPTAATLKALLTRRALARIRPRDADRHR